MPWDVERRPPANPLEVRSSVRRPGRRHVGHAPSLCRAALQSRDGAAHRWLWPGPSFDACAAVLLRAQEGNFEGGNFVLSVSQSVSQLRAPYQWGMRTPESRTYAHIQYTRGQRSSHGVITALTSPV